MCTVTLIYVPIHHPSIHPSRYSLDWGPRWNSGLRAGTQALWEVAVGHPLPADHPTGQTRVSYPSSPRSIHSVHRYEQDPVTTVRKTQVIRLKYDIQKNCFSHFIDIFSLPICPLESCIQMRMGSCCRLVILWSLRNWPTLWRRLQMTGQTLFTPEK